MRDNYGDKIKVFGMSHPDGPFVCIDFCSGGRTTQMELTEADAEKLIKKIRNAIKENK